MDEIWKDIKDWPFHQVSNFGHVRVLPGGKVNHRLIIKTELRILSTDKDGYMMVSRGELLLRVHRLVLEEFVGPCPDGQECRHLNGNPSDNRWPENLEWGTRKKNQEDRIRHGTDNKGGRNGRSKLTDPDIIDIRNRPEQYGIVMQLAIEYKVTSTLISMIRRGKIWEHVGEKSVEYDIPKYPPLHLIPDMEPIELPQMMLSFGS